MLFSLVNVARLASLDAEEALQRAIEKFRRRFTTMEDDLNARGTSIASVTPEELERSWEAVKAQERGAMKVKSRDRPPSPSSAATSPTWRSTPSSTRPTPRSP